MMKITEVKVLNNYKLLLLFDNDEKRLLDISQELSGVFEYLTEYENLKKVQLVHGALTWFRAGKMELDICPDYAYMNSTLVTS